MTMKSKSTEPTQAGGIIPIPNEVRDARKTLIGWIDQLIEVLKALVKETEEALSDLRSALDLVQLTRSALHTRNDIQALRLAVDKEMIDGLNSARHKLHDQSLAFEEFGAASRRHGTRAGNVWDQLVRFGDRIDDALMDAGIVPDDLKEMSERIDPLDAAESERSRRKFVARIECDPPGGEKWSQIDSIEADGIIAAGCGLARSYLGGIMPFTIFLRDEGDYSAGEDESQWPELRVMPDTNGKLIADAESMLTVPDSPAALRVVVCEPQIAQGEFTPLDPDTEDGDANSPFADPPKEEPQVEQIYHLVVTDTDIRNGDIWETALPAASPAEAAEAVLTERAERIESLAGQEGVVDDIVRIRVYDASSGAKGRKQLASFDGDPILEPGDIKAAQAN